MKQSEGKAVALLPLAVFLLLFVGVGIVSGDFYKLPALVAIVIALAVAVMVNGKEKLGDKIERIATGAGHPDLIMMVFIFLLAGAFSATASGMGAVEATVNLALTWIPQHLLLVGLFVIAGFISLSMGTSMGTIAALAPIGVGLSAQTELSLALVMATVVGGAMFGDNLSIISDTTIAAVRTQQTKMSDKFKANFWIVLPAAVFTMLLLFFLGAGNTSTVATGQFHFIKVLPYIGVLLAALWGLNVIAVLAGGILLSVFIGWWDGSFTVGNVAQTVSEGMLGMSELIVLSMLIGGMVELIRANGGLQYLLDGILRRVHSRKGAEAGIAGIVSLANVATANNTISILFAGPVAKEIADRYDVDKRKSASILDIFSCAVQGLLPYGAQMLLVANTAGVSPLTILPYAFYPLLIGVCGILAIIFSLPRLEGKKREKKVASAEVVVNQ
ncbi:Na+/H+ antiporter NhaC family protein [Mechercharimyces sp. CAU 1602]|uniref:Na+/H+ antiporter NhaC family protein n=1 Tax=Mechercharimyces sp. CAU 1602 TaxID=2973933 RepID=UPI002163A6EB|nr:Na+/H+ antiporter NhaC family protein [Mechercharimyces sp. CAU 1602]MCS1350941.1 Na+/H+ antiporter NhaC family protein [Mechercharimyces sp. CAU 1602]